LSITKIIVLAVYFILKVLKIASYQISIREKLMLTFGVFVSKTKCAIHDKLDLINWYFYRTISSELPLKLS